MPVKLNSSGGGSVTLDVPSTASDFTATIPANTGTVVTTGSTGVVTQTMLAGSVAGNGPAFRAYLSNNQVINGSTYTKVLLNVEDFDTNNAFSTANSRFQPSVAGYYQISATAELGSNADIGVIGVFKNGTEVNRFAHLASNNSVNWATFTFTGSAVIYMNGSSDYLELYAFIRALSGTPTVIGGSIVTTMSGALVRAA